jgi:hypothetical protein
MNSAETAANMLFIWNKNGRSRVRFPMVSLDFFHGHNLSGRTMVLGSTQPLTEISTGNISWA